MLFSGFFPGLNRFSPVLVDMDQLLCFPEPLTPAKGFSCSRQDKSCRRATSLTRVTTTVGPEQEYFLVDRALSYKRKDIVAILVVLKIGASSCCAGATSLCSVLANTPNFHNSSFKSAMNAVMRGLMAPK